MKQAIFASVATIALLEAIEFVAGRDVAIGFAFGALLNLIFLYRILGEVSE